MHLIDLLLYGTVSKRRLFFIIDEHATETGHVVESIFCLRNEIVCTGGGLLSEVFLQIGNRWRETKNI